MSGGCHRHVADRRCDCGTSTMRFSTRFRRCFRSFLSSLNRKNPKRDKLVDDNQSPFGPGGGTPQLHQMNR